MPAIRNTQKTLAERLSLNQGSMSSKSLVERLSLNQESTKPLLERITPSISTNPLEELIKTSVCYHKIDKVIFTTCPPELHFHKTKKLLCIKEYKELLEPTLDHISPFFIKMSENKTWAEDLQYDSL